MYYCEHPDRTEPYLMLCVLSVCLLQVLLRSRHFEQGRRAAPGLPVRAGATGHRRNRLRQLIATTTTDRRRHRRRHRRRREHDVVT